MCEVHLVRCLDPEQARCVQRDWLREERRDLFVSSISGGSSKADVHLAVRDLVRAAGDGDGDDESRSYRVLHSEGAAAAHVIFASRWRK